MNAWVEYEGYWYDIQKRGDCVMVYVYNSLQKKVFSCTCDTVEDAEDEAENWIDNEAY